MFAPSPWLLQSVVHKQNEPHLALAVLRVCSVPERATPAPRLWAQRSRVHKGQENHGRVKNRSLLTSQHLPVQTQMSARPCCSTHKQANTQRHTSTDMAHLRPGTHKKIHCTASANPINVCLGYIQQHFHIYNRMIICLNMKLDIVCVLAEMKGK